MTTLEQAKEALNASFPEMAYGEYGGTLTCAVPGLFVIKRDPNPTDKTELFVTLDTIQGISSKSQDESAEDLFRKLFNITADTANRDLVWHRPKEGELFAPVLGESYFLAYAGHPLHKHDAKDLLDFSTVYYAGRRYLDPLNRFQIADYGHDGAHTHLVPSYYVCD